MMLLKKRVICSARSQVWRRAFSLADRERTILEDKMNSLTEGKDEVEKKLGLMMESLETEKTGLLR